MAERNLIYRLKVIEDPANASVLSAFSATRKRMERDIVQTQRESLAARSDLERRHYESLVREDDRVHRTLIDRSRARVEQAKREAAERIEAERRAAQETHRAWDSAGGSGWRPGSGGGFRPGMPGYFPGSPPAINPSGSVTGGRSGALANSIANGLGGVARLGRGLGMLGLVNEEDMESIARGLLKIQGAHDSLKGGVEIWKSLTDGAQAYKFATASVTIGGGVGGRLIGSGVGAAGAGAGAGLGGLKAGGGALAAVGAAAAPVAAFIAAVLGTTAATLALRDAVRGTANDLDSWSTWFNKAPSLVGMSSTTPELLVRGGAWFQRRGLAPKDAEEIAMIDSEDRVAAGLKDRQRRLGENELRRRRDQFRAGEMDTAFRLQDMAKTPEEMLENAGIFSSLTRGNGSVLNGKYRLAEKFRENAGQISFLRNELSLADPRDTAQREKLESRLADLSERQLRITTERIRTEEQLASTVKKRGEEQIVSFTRQIELAKQSREAASGSLFSSQEGFGRLSIFDQQRAIQAKARYDSGGVLGREEINALRPVGDRESREIVARADREAAERAGFSRYFGRQERSTIAAAEAKEQTLTAQVKMENDINVNVDINLDKATDELQREFVQALTGPIKAIRDEMPEIAKKAALEVYRQQANVRNGNLFGGR